MLVLLIIGILFLLLGFMVILNQRYTIKDIGNERNIEEKSVDKNSGINIYRIVLGLFSIILGVFCIVNYIIY